MFSILAIFLIGSISAMSIDLYHSTTCPYCKQILPVVNNLEKQYSDYDFNYYETSQNEKNYNKFLEYGFTGVPAFVIRTCDGREIKFTGADERKLKCELQEMSTLECPTYSTYHSIGGSWFLD